MTLLSGLLAFAGAAALLLSPRAFDGGRPFDLGGFRLAIESAYMDSSGTIVNFSGAPPKTAFGRLVLYDELGAMYPGEDGRNDDKGDEAIVFKAAGWPAAWIGMRFTLANSVFDPNHDVRDHLVPLATIDVPPGGRSGVATPTRGSFGRVSVTFMSAHSGGRAFFIDFETTGADVTFGNCGEVACPPRPSLHVELIPWTGGSPIGMSLRFAARGEVTDVHATGLLVDPGTYTLRLSLGSASLERTVVIG